MRSLTTIVGNGIGRGETGDGIFRTKFEWVSSYIIPWHDQDQRRHQAEQELGPIELSPAMEPNVKKLQKQEVIMDE